MAVKDLDRFYFNDKTYIERAVLTAAYNKMLLDETPKKELEFVHATKPELNKESNMAVKDLPVNKHVKDIIDKLKDLDCFSFNEKSYIERAVLTSAYNEMLLDECINLTPKKELEFVHATKPELNKA